MAEATIYEGQGLRAVPVGWQTHVRTLTHTSTHAQGKGPESPVVQLLPTLHSLCSDLRSTCERRKSDPGPPKRSDFTRVSLTHRQPYTRPQANKSAGCRLKANPPLASTDTRAHTALHTQAHIQKFRGLQAPEPGAASLEGGPRPRWPGHTATSF